MKELLRKAINFGLPVILITTLLVMVWGAVLSVKADTAGVTLQTVVGASPFEFGVDSASLSLGALTPGTPITDKTSTLTVTTNNAGGFNIKASRDDNDTTLDLQSDATVNITDQTAWNSGAPNSEIITSGVDVLAFRVKQAGTDSDCYSSTWWGTGDVLGTSAKYAGLPTPLDTIVNDTTYESASADSIILYYIDVAGTQKTGTYDGGVTYTATVN